MKRELFSGPSSRPRNRAFTLLELLVVIAIIAVLASLLLPTLSRAKESGRTAVCKSNLRQIGIALRMYVDDHEAYPVDADPIPSGGDRYATRRWHQMLYPYTKDEWEETLWEERGYRIHSATGKGIWKCPSMAAIQSAWPHKISTYLYNSRGLSRGESPPRYGLGLGGELLPPPGREHYFRPVHEAEVLVPSDMLAVGDADARADSGFPVIIDKPELSPSSMAAWIDLGIIPDRPANRILSMWRGAIRRRHGGLWNNVFCDGHVGGLKSRELFDPSQDSVRKRWNKDNAPHREIVVRLNTVWD